MSRDVSAMGLPSSSDTGLTAGHDVLADHLSELARGLQNEPDVQETLNAIVNAAVGSVPGADQASISTIEQRREVKTLAATGDLARAVDQAQYDAGQGPCLDALYEHRTVRLPDLTQEIRWPRFTTAASELGVGSMLAVRLYVDAEDLGALNLFSKRIEAFNDDSNHTALLFASHAAVAISGAQAEDHLREAMTTREIIGKAKGILMERFKLTDDKAFLLLLKASHERNGSVLATAQELAATGRL